MKDSGDLKSRICTTRQKKYTQIDYNKFKNDINLVRNNLNRIKEFV